MARRVKDDDVDDDPVLPCRFTTPRDGGWLARRLPSRSTLHCIFVWWRLEPLPGNRAACVLFLKRDEPACEFKVVQVYTGLYPAVGAGGID